MAAEGSQRKKGHAQNGGRMRQQDKDGSPGFGVRQGLG
jgi:hypothetical protein